MTALGQNVNKGTAKTTYDMTTTAMNFINGRYY